MEKLPLITNHPETTRYSKDELYRTSHITEKETLKVDKSLKNVQNFKKYLYKSKFLLTKNNKTNYTENQELKHDITSSYISMSNQFFNETFVSDQSKSQSLNNSHSLIAIEENMKLKKKIDQHFNLNQNPLHFGSKRDAKEYKELITDEEFYEIQERIQSKYYLQDVHKDLLPNAINCVKLNETSYFMIQCRKMPPPLKIRFLFQQKIDDILIFYASLASKRPNNKNHMEKILGIESNRTYQLFLGQKSTNEFSFNRLYISIETKNQIQVKIIFSFGNIPMLISQRKKNAEKNGERKHQFDIKEIEDQVKYYLKNKEEMIELQNEAKRLKFKMKFNNVSSICQKNYINSNINVKETFIELQMKRKKLEEQDKQNKEKSKEKRLEYLKNKLMQNAVQINKWHIRKLSKEILIQYVKNQNNLQKGIHNFVLILQMTLILGKIFNVFRMTKIQVLTKLSKESKYYVIRNKIRKQFNKLQKNIKSRVNLKAKWNLIEFKCFFQTSMFKRNIKIIKQIFKKVLINQKMFSFFTNFYKKCQIIQRGIKEILLIRNLEFDLLVKMWEKKISNLEKESVTKRKQKEIVDKLRKISCEERNKVLKIHLNSIRAVFRIYFRKYLRQPMIKGNYGNKFFSNEKHKENSPEKKVQANNSPKKLMKKPAFIFIPTSEDLSKMILKTIGIENKI